MNKDFIDDAISHVLKKIDQNMEVFTESFPDRASTNQVYKEIGNTSWTNSFWTGMLWLAWEVTGEDKYKNLAEKFNKSFKERIETRSHINTHDLGFLYSLSCVAAYKLTGDKEAKNVAIEAAELLYSRFHKKAGIIQAWGDLTSEHSEERGRMIIDCNMNLPLLYWASEVTGNNKFKDAAISHIKQAAKYIVRDDFSTYHTYYFDPETGEPLRGATHQGFSDNSAWSRGQGWGIYGFLFSQKYVESPDMVELSSKIADYYLERQPEDSVCYWDLIFTEGSEERDSSAAAIAVCGLLELIKYRPNKRYENSAYEILESLYKNYRVEVDSKHNGILKHGVFHKPHNRGVDESCIWGDYFYFEALVRAKKDWNLYW